ncbi:microtubule organization protein AKNA isoform X4 [Acanthopagrus latus]|uniref:microtubule organization protein AKNA isoform X4 n=1 Tax=Acanthopagrus latus TaxID=8177 RepID=UPI00187CD56B|nr:microtubule organization protein AKNA isoform X4 [Acanthopagrus latus]
METRKSTTAGVLFWTPAPAHTSPSSSVISEDLWEDEDDEQAGKDADFVSQMDENGIIGLSEALEHVELVEDAEYDPNFYPGRRTTEEPDLCRHEVGTPHEELSYNLSEHLSHSESPGEDGQILSPYDDLIGSFTAQAVDEDAQGIGCLLERDKYLDMTEMGKDGKEAGKRSDRKRKIIEHSSTLGELRTHYGLAESSSPYCSAHLQAMEPAGDSSHRCQTSHPASPVTASSLAHLLRFTAEEMAACPRIEAETFPEISFTESLPDSHRSHRSLKSSPRPEIKLTAFTRPASTISVEVTSNHYSGVNNGPSTGSFKSDKHDKQPTPSPRKMKQQSPRAAYSSGSLGTDSLKCKHQTSSPDRELRTPRARSNAAEVDEPSKGSLSFRTPDFSKVEPKVRFPKAGYKPPKSRRSFKRDSLSPEPPLVFKSPADIVKEVLLNIPDGSPAPQDSYTLPASAPDFTVPQEFRSPRHATTLLEQLQEQYNTLLTKYAEAENTIDRLRLEAKVNLYSDPPKPGHSVQSGLNQRASRIMMLDFPQAQRAETNSASLNPNGHSTPQRSSSAGPSTRSPVPQVGQQLAVILYIQTDKFLQQLQTFEDLLKCKKLKPLEEVKGVSQLTEGLDSLERGYLLARDQHKLLQQQGAEISHFDPERELEGLIFQCGLRMDELKELVEQTQQEQSTCRTPSPSTPLPNSSSVPSEGGEILTQPQGPPQPWMVDPGQAAVEVSSVSEESDEETLNSLDLSALNEHRRREQDFADHNQSFQELPKHIDHSQREGARPPAAGRTNMQPGEEEEERQSQGTGSMDVTKSLLQRKSDHVDSPPPCTSKQQTSRTSPPSRRASSQSTTFPVDPTSSRRLEVGKSHSSSLSSLGEINTSQRRNSKLLSGSSRVLSQDGIISPETDSGFVGSESSRLTPAAAHSPLHQRASESVPGPQDGKPRRPQTGPISAPPRASSPTHSRTAMEPNKGCQLASEQPRRSRQGRRGRTFSCSPQRWISQTERSRAGSETSEFGLQSDSSHCVSEDEQNDRYTDSISPLHSSSLSSSPAERRHHGNSLQALSSSQVANRNEAIQTLQAEVTRLRERLESFRSNKKPPSTVKAAPSAPQNTSTPRVRSGDRRGDISRVRGDRQTVDEVDESTLRRTARNRPSSVHTRKPKPEILTAAEPSPPQPPPLVSRCTQTSTAAPDNSCSHTHTVRSRTHPRQQSGVSVQVCQTADEPDRGSRQAPLCPQCLSSQQGRAGGPLGGNKEPTHSSRCRHCPVCGCRDPYASTEPDCRRVSDSPPHTRHQPATSPDGAARSRHFAAAAPATLLQYMPVCSQPLLLYSAPLYISPGNSTGTSSGVRVREEARGRTRRSLSADKQRSTDSSLNRAIRAARHMKHTSGHMARSLAAGLHYQELLSQSCSY